MPQASPTSSLTCNSDNSAAPLAGRARAAAASGTVHAVGDVERDGGAVAGAEPAPKKRKGGERALPTTPAQRAAALHKAVHKSICAIQSVTVRMTSLRFQEPMKNRLDEMSVRHFEIYKEVGKLVKAGTDDDKQIEVWMTKYVALKNETKDRSGNLPPNSSRFLAVRFCRMSIELSMPPGSPLAGAVTLTFG